MLFQFHAGSIKGSPQPPTDYPGDSGGGGYYGGPPVESPIPRFNSTLVRLKVAGLGGGLYCLIWFQFHAGSIKGKWDIEFIHI